MKDILRFLLEVFVVGLGICLTTMAIILIIHGLFVLAGYPNA